MMEPELYFSIPSDGAHHLESKRQFLPTTTHERLWRTTKPLSQVLLYTLAILGMITIAREAYTLGSTLNPGHESRVVSCSCGNNVAEALAQGCKYDLLASAWLPEQCRDDELSAEFDRSGPGANGEWTYYADAEGTRLINASDLGALADLPGFLYYTTLEWHMVHCYFYWIKAWRTKQTRLTIEKRYDTETHIRHCSRVLMTREVNLQSVATSQGASLMSGEEEDIE